MDLKQFTWTGEPASYEITEGVLKVVTKPHTDLWQRTYYHFQNDNAPVFQIVTDEPYFTFTVKTDFNSQHRFDQCGIVMYLDSENWLKASIEYENESISHLGSVVTNLGYSDWATTEVAADIKYQWFRLSRREDDFKLEASSDGVHYSQLRICHMHKLQGPIRFGVYACSPEDSSFTAIFSEFDMGECLWQAHDGQAADY